MERSELIDSIIVATGPGSENEVIRDEAIRWGFDCPYTKRHEDDVLGRFMDAAILYQGDIIVRITGDCPLIDAGIVDRVIDSLGNNDFATNVWDRTFPKGLDTEVIPVTTLYALDSTLSADHPDREHVCSFLYKQNRILNIASVTDDEDHSDLVWCVDDEEDFERVSGLLKFGILPYDELLEKALDGN